MSTPLFQLLNVGYVKKKEKKNKTNPKKTKSGDSTWPAWKSIQTT